LFWKSRIVRSLPTARPATELRAWSRPQYAAGKYGLLGITKSYAKALGPSVRVNTFAAGFMETEALLARPEWKAGRREDVRSGTPAGKIPNRKT
jgi:NAD(P)-dependent dehydrogenase (short-subunit alcohol dehydrogenase family)